MYVCTKIRCVYEMSAKLKRDIVLVSVRLSSMQTSTKIIMFSFCALMLQFAFHVSLDKHSHAKVDDRIVDFNEWRRGRRRSVMFGARVELHRLSARFVVSVIACEHSCSGCVSSDFDCNECSIIVDQNRWRDAKEKGGQRRRR